MTREEAIKYLKAMKDGCNDTCHKVRYVTHEEALDMAISALEKPCELLILKSDILLHQDDRKKWAESIKQEKEKGLIILPPYFTPLLVPNDIEIRIEQQSEDVISREAVDKYITELLSGYLYDEERERLETFSAYLWELPSVTVRQSELKPFTAEHHKVYMEGWNDGRKKLLEAMEREIAY